jgi:hypothetical protein
MTLLFRADDRFTTCLLTNSRAFVCSEVMIKKCNHPLFEERKPAIEKHNIYFGILNSCREKENEDPLPGSL